MKVKELTADELPRIEALGHAFAKEVGYPAFNMDTFCQLWRAVLAQNLGAFLYVESDGEVVGVLGASFVPDPLSGDLVGYENFWFVREDKRQSRAGIDLLMQFEKTARARGCKRMVMIHLANSKEDVLPKIYARFGYKPVEHHYWKSLE